MNQKNDVIEIDLREIMGVLINRIWVILISAIAGGLIFGLVSIYLITPKYTSTSKIYILANSSSVVSIADLQIGSSLANDYEELIKSRPVVESVIEKLDLDITYGEMLDCISIANKENTRIVQITATYQDPVIAMQIANEFATVSRDQISEIMKVEKPTKVEEAVVSKKQSSPNNQKNILIGVLIGLIASAGVIILRYQLDDTLTSSEDVERYLGLNTLAAIPDEGGTDNSEKHEKKRFRGIRRG
ncbi:MAG: YveK family protein [Lachnospiraceae bacterium]